MTTLIKRIDEQHVIINRHASYCPIVLCSNYDPEAPEGSQWDWGHYFGTVAEAEAYAVEQGYIKKAPYKYVVIETLLGLSGEIGVHSFDTEAEALELMADELQKRVSLPELLKEGNDIVSVWGGGFWCDVNGEGLQMELKRIDCDSNFILLCHSGEDASATIEGQYITDADAVAALGACVSEYCAECGYWEVDGGNTYARYLEDGDSLLHIGVYYV